MKFRFYLLTFVIILGLVFSSGLIAENINQNVETDENPGIQPQEFPIPEELIGFETQTYGNLDADEFFWVEDYFVEDLGDGIGIVITPPTGDPILLPAGYDLNKVNETTIAYHIERYGEVVNESYSYRTLIYHVPTGTQTLLPASYGEIESLLTNEGILFDNYYTNVATYYMLDGSEFVHDYSHMDNSTYNAYVDRMFNDHIVIAYYNRDVSFHEVIQFDYNRKMQDLHQWLLQQAKHLAN